MSTTLLMGLLVICGLMVIVLYWELVIAEGVHLGSGVVVRLYDWTADRYEAIKRFQPKFEDLRLGFPLTTALIPTHEPFVLDVAAGTGRLARTLLRQLGFDGRVVALDLSELMLRQIDQYIPERVERVDLLLSPADRLPFSSNMFEAVACLEALEFMPDPLTVLAECVRVLRPGGQLVVSNRVGPQARWLIGKTFARPNFEDILIRLGLHLSRVDIWQTDYDLAWATKPDMSDQSC